MSVTGTPDIHARLHAVDICAPAEPGLPAQGRPLVCGLSAEIPRGSLVAVTGPSGAGKSTFLACLAGRLCPAAGRIDFSCRARCVHPPQGYRHRLGVVFQNLLLVPDKTLLENVLLGRLGRYHWTRTLFGFPKRDRAEARDLLDRLGIGHLAGKRAREVSGGEQQRTAVARAVFQQPEMLLADEPVSQLDETSAAAVLALLHEETRRAGMTAICVLHQRRLVEEFADIEIHIAGHGGCGEGWSMRRFPR